MTDKDAARQRIRELVERWRTTPKNERDAYNEDQTQHYFILPLFRALGWDTENPSEFSAEEQISRGFVDFGFYLNDVPLFYLETKKASENIDKPAHMRQSINYAYLKGVTWAVLSDFEGIMVFNAEWEETDPLKTRFLNLDWEQYAESQFEDLWLLSKSSMQAHEIDKQAERYGRKAKKEPVTKLLFAQLTEWRKSLFAEMRAWGNNLWSADPHAVDNAVQKLLDRLIFLRTVEDRGVEGPRLKEVLRQAENTQRNPFPDLLNLFREMDGVYNSNLFAESSLDLMEFHDPGLLREIINGLYRAPGGFATYDFNAISADVLGAVYEQYLSFKAQDPEARQAIDISKRTKRKSQGIYYTPQFVVRYIVRQTLGKLLESPDMTPEKAHQLTILDPACGSGSFLIEAFDVLDRWLAQNGDETDRQFPRRRRLRILQENLYGVDLDDQAVEVTRLNLMLRAALERGKLPLLTHIQHGNSLVDDSAGAGETAFKWEERFPVVMERGGFDAVVGNPPYVRQETLGAAFKEYAQANYQTYAGTADLYVYFVERSHQLLKPGGYFGMICSNKFMRANYGLSLRRFLLKQTALNSIVDFGELPVFQDAATFPVIITTQNQPAESQRFVYAPIKHLDFDSLDDEIDKQGSFLDERSLNGTTVNWTLAKADEVAILNKMRQVGVPLGEYVDGKILYGIKTGYNEAFIIDRSTRNRLIKEDAKSAEIIKPFVVGNDVRNYQIKLKERFLIFTRRGIPITEYPAIENYLSQFKERLTPKPGDWKGNGWTGRKSGRYQWYEIQDTVDYYPEFEKPKIIYPVIAKEPRFTLDTSGYFSNDKTFIIPYEDRYLLGILNSKLAWLFLKRICSVLGDPDKGGRLELRDTHLKRLPIRRINVDDPIDKARHDKMAALVEKMLALKQEHATAETTFSDKRHELAEQIAYTDQQIDALVYELYGLTPDEIALVEG
jgi:type I restriction-modification system DNA methylase subunit